VNLRQGNLFESIMKLQKVAKVKLQKREYPEFASSAPLTELAIAKFCHLV
jgi:hypothetical protein